MAYQLESSKVLEIPPNFNVGLLIGRKGKNIRGIQEMFKTEINISQGSKTLEISGSPDNVKSAEEFVLAFFNSPSRGLRKIDESRRLRNEVLAEAYQKCLLGYADFDCFFDIE